MRGRRPAHRAQELCEKFCADLSIEVTDVLPKVSFEFAVDGLGAAARSKKEAKEQAAALALRALAREPPRDL